MEEESVLDVRQSGEVVTEEVYRVVNANEIKQLMQEKFGIALRNR